METLVICRLVVPPPPKTSMVCAALVVPITWLANVKLEGETDGGTTSPVPLRLVLIEEADEPKSILSEPVRWPPATGVKVTWMVQLLELERAWPHVLVWLKSPVVVTEAIWTQP